MAKQDSNWIVVTRMTDGVRFFVKETGRNTETTDVSQAYGWHYKADAVIEADRLQLMHTNVGRRSWFAARV